MKALFAGAVVLTLFFCFQTGTGIKCYICNSFYDPGCADWFDNRTYPLSQCEGHATMCRKTIQETYTRSKWDTRVIRQCAHEGKIGGDEGRQCVNRVGMYRVMVKYCQCDAKDGCNGAPPTKVFSYSTILASILTVLGLTLRTL